MEPVDGDVFLFDEGLEFDAQMFGCHSTLFPMDYYDPL